MPAAEVTLNLTSFGLVTLAVTLPLVIISLTYTHVTRTCHQCGRRTRVDKRQCTNCGYDASPVSFRR